MLSLKETFNFAFNQVGMVGRISNLVRDSWTSSGDMFSVGEGGGSNCCFEEFICDVWIVSVGINSGDGGEGVGGVGACGCELLFIR